MSLKLVNWNVEWAKKTNNIGKELLRRISEADADVICLTECHTDFLSDCDGDYLITSAADYGYKSEPSRRKVVLWSKNPWRDVDGVGSDDLPPGRFVSGITETPIGDVRVIGICIPWFNSHVCDGHKNRKQWQDHLLYLEALDRILNELPLQRTILVGDYNQPIPKREKAPPEVFMALHQAVSTRMTIATCGMGFQGARTIDHIALSRDLVAESIGVISNLHRATELSDHFGIAAELTGKAPE